MSRDLARCRRTELVEVESEGVCQHAPLFHIEFLIYIHIFLGGFLQYPVERSAVKKVLALEGPVLFKVPRTLLPGRIVMCF